MGADIEVETKEPGVECVGRIVYAFGPLIHVETDAKITKGAIAYVVLENGIRLMSEVIEIDNRTIKLQVFEDTRGVAVGMMVEFTQNLLSATLAPGLLGKVFDGLQNPLSELTAVSGIKLARGVYLDALGGSQTWPFVAEAHVGDTLRAGNSLGYVLENDIKHSIPVPFHLKGDWKVENITDAVPLSIDAPVATLLANDGTRFQVTMRNKWPIKRPLMCGEKIVASEPMKTGMRILDMKFPLLKGGSFCSPGPFGAGKTMLQNHLSRYSDVDIVVIIACGERAGEVVQFMQEFKEIIDEKRNRPLMDRTVMICNTSSMPVAARESSLYLGITIGEYYRQMGLNVLVIADSTSRWAQAIREISGKLEEIPGEEAYPPYLASAIANLYERSGVICNPDGIKGSLTIGGTVSPAGGNFEEPVTQATLSVVGAFIGLSKARADARKFPAIDPAISWSNNIDRVALSMGDQELWYRNAIEETTKLIREGEDIGRRIEVLGEDGITVLDLTRFLQAEMYDFVFLQQNAFDEDDKFSDFEKSHVILNVLLKVFKVKSFGDTPDDVRSLYSKIRFMIKNLCYLQVGTDEFKNQEQKIEALLLECA